MSHQCITCHPFCWPVYKPQVVFQSYCPRLTDRPKPLPSRSYRFTRHTIVATAPITQPSVIPAKAGIHSHAAVRDISSTREWILACARMTRGVAVRFLSSCRSICRFTGPSVNGSPNIPIHPSYRRRPVSTISGLYKFISNNRHLCNPVYFTTECVLS